MVDLFSNYFLIKIYKNLTCQNIRWTPLTMDIGSFKQCDSDQSSGKKTCFFTNSRKYWSFEKHYKAFMFYGTDFALWDLPLPRKKHEDWALMHEESPKNNYLFSFESIMKLFNHTATFKRESDRNYIFF